jgi:signal transduction histidine kinase
MGRVAPFVSEDPLLNWAIMAISFFNTILLLWLAVTVLVNAEIRAWGIWLAAGGLLLGGAFFVSHTAIQGLLIGGHLVSGYTAIISVGLLSIGRSMIFWWTAGLIPAIALPFAWYVIILWYGGFWNDQQSSLYRRQRLWFRLAVLLLTLGLAGLVVGIVLLAIPSQRLLSLRIFIRWSVAGIPMMALAYSGFVLLCITLSLDALRRPGPTPRMMGGLARQRARPWLVAASVALLVVSFLVTGTLLWVVEGTRHQMLHEFYAGAAESLAWVDLIVSAIIGLVIILLGQAVVSYEIFTGKSLPRRGLLRHWQQVIILAAAYSLLVSGAIAISLRPLYSLLLTTLVMTFFVALSSWRSYAERERYIDNLRPFVSSHHLYDHLLAPASPPIVNIDEPFHALCNDVLEATSAKLIAVGPLAPLVTPLHHGREPSDTLDWSQIVNQFDSPEDGPKALDPSLHDGAIWAIPLWSERGLIGIFLLGEKRDRALYTQEEIDIARVSGERLVDTQASAEMARRLMSLQRERLAQSQVIDQTTRRTLHDDILPTLHSAMISLGEPESDTTGIVSALAGAHRQISDLLHEIPTTSAPEVARLGLINGLRQAVENDLAHAFDEVTWELHPPVSEEIEKIPAFAAEVLFYAAREVIRNAARHGRSEGTDTFHLQINMSWDQGLNVVILDNGVGLGTSKGKFRTQAGSNHQNGGQGLALHSTMMAIVGGTLAVDSVAGEFTRVSLSLPSQ